ncbi:hypothetical protein F5Y06DRAFT_303388 [Hypoxylon sp. FL0890]|nr:hypothetical protein F5Y06DRAFT_303388 [Hypoxylon sp. FL0890]
MIIFTTIIAIITLILILAAIFIEQDYINKESKLSYLEARKDVQEHRAIADFSVLGKTTLLDRLASRAIPNKRLIEVFDLVNPFTTVSPTVYTQSVRTARNAIHAMDKDKWIDFFNSAEKVMEYLGGLGNPVPLTKIVRRLVFAAMLRPFFDVEPTKIAFGDILTATQLINELWVESKKTPRQDLQRHQERLQVALQRILPHCFPCQHKDHPLNIIIPAYETMWRVVLLTYVSVGFRAIDEETNEQFLRVVEAFPQCLDSGNDSELLGIALNFAKEGLRLYPPTKRIRRAVPSDPLNPQSSSHVVAADVEKCHRDTRIWGADAEVFRPSRFDNLTDAMKEAYMPFGAGKHQCPTSSKFGYRAIIILVVVLAGRLGTQESGSRMRFKNRKLDEDLEEVLPSGRMDMEDWDLERNLPDVGCVIS